MTRKDKLCNFAADLVKVAFAIKQAGIATQESIAEVTKTVSDYRDQMDQDSDLLPEQRQFSSLVDTLNDGISFPEGSLADNQAVLLMFSIAFGKLSAQIAEELGDSPEAEEEKGVAILDGLSVVRKALNFLAEDLMGGKVPGLEECHSSEATIVGVEGPPENCKEWEAHFTIQMDMCIGNEHRFKSVVLNLTIPAGKDSEHPLSIDVRAEAAYAILKAKLIEAIS